MRSGREYFSGRIDEVKVYNRALTAAEITTDMNSGGTTPPARITLTSPAANAVITGSTVNVTYTTTGDTSQATYAALRLDSGTTTFVPVSGGTAQFTGVAAGAHTLNAWLATADQNKITGSDSSAVAFTAQAVAGPKMTFTAPANNSTVTGSSVTVSFATAGDLTEANHIHLSLDGGSEMMVMSLTGSVQLDSIAQGFTPLTGYVVRGRSLEDHRLGCSADHFQRGCSATATRSEFVLAREQCRRQHQHGNGGVQHLGRYQCGQSRARPPRQRFGA